MLLGAGALTALGVLAAPQLASAHVADVVKSCEQLEVSVSLFDDSVQTRVTIDGTSTIQNGNGHWVFAWSQTESHSYNVVVDAVNPADDKSFSGEQEACVAPPQSSAVATTTAVATAAAAQETPTTPAPTATMEEATPTTLGTPITQSLSTSPTRVGNSGGGSGSSAAATGSGSGDLPSTGPNDNAPYFAAAGVAALVGGSALVYAARRGTRGNSTR
jgi:LPXTG-motif cell wall-anchored protein